MRHVSETKDTRTDVVQITHPRGDSLVPRILIQKLENRAFVEKVINADDA